jgi:hypothetical protein
MMRNLPDPQAPTAAAFPAASTSFTLDCAYAHALLAPRSPSVFASQPDPFRTPPTVRCINPHLIAPARGARP